jgi:hypothetical protein
MQCATTEIASGDTSRSCSEYWRGSSIALGDLVYLAAYGFYDSGLASASFIVKMEEQRFRVEVIDDIFLMNDNGIIGQLLLSFEQRIFCSRVRQNRSGITSLLNFLPLSPEVRIFTNPITPVDDVHRSMTELIPSISIVSILIG